MKVLLAPSNVANQSTAIAAGLSAIGDEAHIWNYGPSPNGFKVDREYNPISAADYLSIFNQSLDENFDVYHFHTARSLIPAREGLPQMWDLPILRAMGKKIVVSFHGSDIRRASHHINDDKWSFYRFADIPCDEEKIDTRLAIIRTYAHHMTVSSILDKVYLPEATYLPKSLDIDQYIHSPSPRARRPVVLHATRRRETKGTNIIENELNKLQSEFDFEVRIVEGATHQQLLHEIASADIVVEKLLGGDAGVLSLEAMAMGRVAVARIRDEVLQRHPALPVQSADPESFGQIMAKLLSSTELRANIGIAGRKYVEHEHSAKESARLLKTLYSTPNIRTARPHPDWGSDPSPRKLEGAFARIRKLESSLAQYRRQRKDIP